MSGNERGSLALRSLRFLLVRGGENNWSVSVVLIKLLLTGLVASVVVRSSMRTRRRRCILVIMVSYVSLVVRKKMERTGLNEEHQAR